jgi:hypothetical protein
VKDQSSNNNRLQERRRFMTSALVGGAGTLFASGVLANAQDSTLESVCGELTAADPLALYSPLVQRLQPAAIQAVRKGENLVQDTESDKLSELWELSDKLKALLPKNSKAESTVERVNSLAYIGKTNAHAVSSGLISRSRETLRAHARSQQLVMAEILKASASLARGDVKISAEAWSLLQQMLSKIQEIRNYHPKVDAARDEFNKALDNINDQIAGIQSALMAASAAMVKGDKAEATAQVKEAIAIIKALPGYEKSQSDVGKKVVTQSEANAFTAKKLVELLDPGTFDLINGSQTLPKVSRRRSTNRADGFSLTPAAYVSGANSASLQPPVDPQSVKAIVQLCLVSGSWLQVVGVAAACLPLWSYPRSEHRKSLIYSALSVIPRGRDSKLWEAAYYLNQLRS